ncbi:MAG: 16S rRNA (uracil(1498)-N(3))-methyltransferase [Deltaproteobacteria bacterium]|nr:16S rRNA (uracil(1498)-N(3))-methyltransferase [Deltaproteobacteria bacterium]MBW2387799.1 16S rRNA (uracil(1498)-N(3))-methyltransferase [Deltaproteobacteria bacterium]
MNLILLFEEDFISGGADGAGGKVRLAGRRSEHVQSIHRAVAGDQLCVGFAGGRIGRGTVVRIDREGLELEVEFERDPPPPLPVTLVIALPRPLVLKRLLITATAMGVKRIFLIQSNRVERSFWNSKVLREGELIKPLVLGLEQARDTRLPDVELRTRFRPFVEDELPGLVVGTQGLVAHPDAELECPRDVEGAVTLVMGPEGGFVPFEIEKLEASGCAVVHLGERILRMEAALPALLGRLF